MSKLINCSTCGKEIAYSAKKCPNCGAKNKKPFYKKVWFWVLTVIIVIGIGGAAGSSNSNDTVGKDKETIASGEENKQNEEAKAEENVPTEYKSALRKAKSYSDTMYMSKAGLYEQLTSEYGEKFTAEAAQYAVDNVEADWKENALKKAKTYQETMDMSPSAIYDQLVSEYGEKFTAEEAKYAINNLK